MILVDGNPRLTVRDLAALPECDYAAAAQFDVLYGLADAAPVAMDTMAQRVAALGMDFEKRLLGELEARLGPAARPPRPARFDDSAATAAAMDATLACMIERAPLIYQPFISGDGVYGFADFLLWDADAGAYVVVDAKYATTPGPSRSANKPDPAHLLQVATYAVVLANAGAPIAGVVRLAYADGGHWDEPLSTMRPLVESAMIQASSLGARASKASAPQPWAETENCGTCEWCAPHAAAALDTILVYGLNRKQRAKLAGAGVATMRDLASHDRGAIAGIGDAVLDALIDQASLHVKTLDDGGTPAVHVFGRDPLDALPDDDAGDLFFDFEGDPLWTSPDGVWGIEYLWGYLDREGAFTALWAHDRAGEAAALRTFVTALAERRMTHPGMHVYHYAAYEVSALRRLVKRHSWGDELLESLVGDGVFVDLYATVKHSVRTSQPSLSIKKLEPLYMGDELRSGVDNAADSIAAYADACAAREAGDTSACSALLADIEDYNRYDCLSTLRLLDWLRTL